MTFSQIMNSKLLYILVIAAIAYVLVFSVLTLIRSWKHGQEIGLSKEKLKGAIISSAIYSILPSISIIIGLFSLTAVLGVPWSWFRLSVVGSVMYELMAADMATASGYESIGALSASGDPQLAGTIMFVMSVCILGGIVGSIIFTKGIQSGLEKARSKGGFGILATSVLSIAITAAYVPLQLSKGRVHAAVLLTSALVAVLHNVIIKKFHCNWLKNFVMADSLLLGMISSLLWINLLG